MKKFTLLSLFTFTLLVLPFTLWADSREITSQELHWDYQKNKATFIGKVNMSGTEGRIECEKMTVLFKENDEIEKILAEEGAKLFREDKKGGGETIEIFPTQDQLVIKGEAWIATEKIKFSGEEITFGLKNNVIKVQKGVQGKIETTPSEGEDVESPGK